MKSTNDVSIYYVFSLPSYLFLTLEPNVLSSLLCIFFPKVTTIAVRMMKEAQMRKICRTDGEMIKYTEIVLENVK
jgi:hypothetical protein